MDNKYYTYCEPDEYDRPVMHTLSETEILKAYKPYFLEQMKKVTRKVPTITDELILDNWIVINWAWETDSKGNNLKLIKE